MDKQIKEQLKIYKDKPLNLLEALAYAVLLHSDKPVSVLVLLNETQNHIMYKMSKFAVKMCYEAIKRLKEKDVLLFKNGGYVLNPEYEPKRIGAIGYAAWKVLGYIDKTVL